MDNHLDKYLIKSKEIHGDIYDYSKVNYKNAKTKVEIICKIHGSFIQNMDNHSNGQGCPKCKIDNFIKRQLSNTKEFIEKSIKVHGVWFDYSLVEYKNAKTKVKIICPIHGVFEQKPNNHLSGYGCSKCRTNTQEFIKKSIKIHGNRYDYSLVNYVDSKTPVKIICPIHGVFEQKPIYHLKCKNACKKCQSQENRLRIIKRIEKNKLNGNQLYPNYNEKACKLFDKMNKDNNIKIKHAKNGGEYYIKELGYWVDGYDKENNVVYEYDEKYHFDKNNKLKIKDIKRQKEIINFLKCDFIRIKEINI